MVAKAAPIVTLPGSPSGWVYDICRRPQGNVNVCPYTGAKPNLYGGTLLQLQQGDTMKADKMATDKMKGDKMEGDKMAADKMEKK